MKKFKDFTEDQKTKALSKALDLGCDLEDQAHDILKLSGNSAVPSELQELLRKNGSKEALELLNQMKSNDKEIHYLFTH